MRETEFTYRDAIREAMTEEMARDPSVILLGEDIGTAGGVFKQTEGLLARFGEQRVIDTPISEAGALGLAVGAAMTGARPIFEVMFGDFITLILDQLMNQAAKISYMSAGAFTVPLVVRVTIGSGSSLGPQHSQSPYTLCANIPGLKIAVPARAADAKLLLQAAIRDNGPVVVFEDRNAYALSGPRPTADASIELGRASVVRSGKDATVIAVGRMVRIALQAAEALANDGIEIEVVDPRTLVPLDVETMAMSLRKTGRALVLDMGPALYGVAGEIASSISEAAFDWLDAPVMRLAAANVPLPVARTLERLVVPDATAVAAAVKTLTYRS
jgi:acetoin:2,6-dichlorophenolindophenol oxidoreductase subunit beta